MMRIPSLYGPDGVPLDGPRTTAAEHVADVVAVRRASHGRAEWLYQNEYIVLSMTYELWRGAAADEGERYAEAIRGARAMRHAVALLANRNLCYLDCATANERRDGSPSFADRRDGRWLTERTCNGHRPNERCI